MYYRKIEIVILVLFITFVNAIERELTVSIGAGREECFFQNVKEGEKIDFEYQVIDGDYAELSITFHLVDPTGRILVADYKKAENSHRVNAQLNGDYRFCFDNTHSKVHTKTIFFELVIENEDEDWETIDPDLGNLPTEVYEMTVEEIQESTNKVRNHLRAIQHYQALLKSTEARDRNLAEQNYNTVNIFSAVQISVMIFVGVTQIVLIRALFDDKSTVRALWNKVRNNSR